MTERSLSERHAKWLEDRGLDVEQIVAFGVYSARSAPKQEGEQGFREPLPDANGPILVVPYRDRGREVNAKFRGKLRNGERFFYQRPGSPKTFCNVDVLDAPEVTDEKTPVPVVITEGEPDMFAAIQCGHPWTMSVPDGAPADKDQHGKAIPMKPDAELDPANDPKFEYVAANWERLEKVKRFILATDGDGPGQRLRDELARRLGRVRCMTVEYPREERVPLPLEEGHPFGAMRAPKDLNDVLRWFGPEVVRDVLAKAKPYPVQGLYELDDFPDQQDLVTFDLGFPDLKDFIRLYVGAFLVVSGIPEHGKSAWVDQLVFNLAVRYGWRTAFASFEEPIKPSLLNKFIGFFTMKPRRAWTQQDRDEAKGFVRRHFCFITDDPHGDGEPATIEWLIDRAIDAVIRFGINVLVVDPWNEMDHKRRPGEMRDEYTARAIRALKRFGKQYDVIVIVIVHPTKEAGNRAMRDDEPMSVYDISDGAMWYNKGELIVIVARGTPPNEVGRAMAKISVKKVKFWESGKRGEAVVVFDTVLRMFHDGPVETEQQKAIDFSELVPLK